MAHSNETEIGDRVRAVRLRAGLSREALAFQSGLSWSAIAQIESGRRTNLRPATLEALARALGVTIDYLVSGRRAATAMIEHRALLYRSEAELLSAATDFLAAAVERGEAVLAVLGGATIRRLRRRLGPAAEHVRFSDRRTSLRDPAWTLATMREFVERQLDGGSPWVRILGEPAWSGRTGATERAWVRFESLVNLVFESMPVTIVCPYDAATLDPRVLDHARATHPQVMEHDVVRPSREYLDPGVLVLAE